MGLGNRKLRRRSQAIPLGKGEILNIGGFDTVYPGEYAQRLGQSQRAGCRMADRTV